MPFPRLEALILKFPPSEFMAPFLFPVSSIMLFIITDTIGDGAVEIFPYSGTEGTAEGAVADEDDVFCGGNRGDGLVYGTMWDFTSIRSPNEETFCIFVKSGETFGGIKSIGGKVSCGFEVFF